MTLDQNGLKCGFCEVQYFINSNISNIFEYYTTFLFQRTVLAKDYVYATRQGKDLH